MNVFVSYAPRGEEPQILSSETSWIHLIGAPGADPLNIVLMISQNKADQLDGLAAKMAETINMAERIYVLAARSCRDACLTVVRELATLEKEVVLVSTEHRHPADCITFSVEVNIDLRFTLEEDPTKIFERLSSGVCLLT